MSGAGPGRWSKAQERRYAAWLRTEGLHIEARRTLDGLTHRGHHGDLEGVGPRIIEITFRPWERMPEKLRQAEGDARSAGLAEYWVWRPVRRAEHEAGTVARSVLIGRAEVVWPLLAELDELRKAAGR